MIAHRAPAHTEVLRPSPLLVRLMRQVRRHAPSLGKELMARQEAPNAAAGRWSVAEVRADLDVWFAVLTGETAGPDIERSFRRRGHSHAGQGLHSEDAILLQHAAVGLLREHLATVVAEFTTPASDDGEHEAVCREAAAFTVRLFDDLTRAALAVATTALAAGFRAARARPHADAAQQAVEALVRRNRQVDGAPRLPAYVRTPLYWCLTTAVVDEPARFVGRFRALNPHGLVSTVDGRLVCFTHQRPHVPDDSPRYGLAAVHGDDTGRAARHGVLAADMARRYELNHVDAHQALPLIEAADLEPEHREAFVAACLGPLHTSERHRHLLDTLRAYLAHGLRTTSAARSLYVHRHTFTYRLRCIQSLTGLDLDQPFHRLRAELALFLLATCGDGARPARPAAG